jgi:hypothetical protein
MRALERENDLVCQLSEARAREEKSTQEASVRERQFKKMQLKIDEGEK